MTVYRVDIPIALTFEVDTDDGGTLKWSAEESFAEALASDALEGLAFKLLDGRTAIIRMAVATDEARVL